MYYILSIIAGVIISVMIMVNGALTGYYGTMQATVIIHIVGLIFISLWILKKKENPFSGKRLPFYLYLGGALGTFTTVFNNAAFGKISVSAILALCLFGQSVNSILIDEYGWFKMPRTRFNPRKLWGLFIILLGIVFMIFPMDWQSSMIVAIVMSFLSGVTIVTSRTVNAWLAAETSELKSTFFNYVIGLAGAGILLFTMGGGIQKSAVSLSIPQIWIFTGGLLGVFVVLISNMTVAKISSFSMTLLMFIGQVFTGIVLDIFLSGEFSFKNLVGGICVSGGLIVNMLIDRKVEQRNNNTSDPL